MCGIKRFPSMILIVFLLSAVISGGVLSEAVAPDAPVISSCIQCAATTAKITWNAVSGANGYVLYYAPGEGAPYSYLKTTLTVTFNHTGLTPGASNFYKVRAYTLDGADRTYSGYSVPASVKILAKPQILSVQQAGSNAAAIQWGAVNDASFYVLYRSVGSGGPYTYIKTVMGTAFTNISLTTGYTYCYKVAACRMNGTSKVFSVQSDAAQVIVLAKSAVTSVLQTNSVTALIRWNTVSGAAGYSLYRSGSASGNYAHIKTTSGTSFSNTGLTPGAAYFYKVAAYYMNGTVKVYGERSDAACVNILAKPVITSAQHASSTSAAVRWNAVSNAAGYILYRSAGAGGTYSYLKTVLGTGYNDAGLTPDTVYYYKVTAYRANGTAKIQSVQSDPKRLLPMPVAGTAVELPELPKIINYCTTAGRLTSSVNVTDISYTVEPYVTNDKVRIHLYFDGTKTFDYYGVSHNYACHISWKLYDSAGNVTAGGTVSSPVLAVGETFINSEAVTSSIPRGNYTLVIVDDL